MTTEQASRHQRWTTPSCLPFLPVVPSSAPAVSSGLAALILEDNLSKGKEIEIPSLGILFVTRDEWDGASFGLPAGRPKESRVICVTREGMALSRTDLRQTKENRATQRRARMRY